MVKDSVYTEGQMSPWLSGLERDVHGPFNEMV